MGKRDRERIERIESGEERSRAAQVLSNPVARTAVKLATRGQVVDEMRKAGVAEQVDVLGATVGASRPDKLRKAIAGKAPHEMDKAIRKFQKQGKPVTVDTLCAEVKSTPGFLKMCERVGLDLAWFENLARERMEAYGL